MPMTSDDGAVPAGIEELHGRWVTAVTRPDAELLRDLVTDDYEVWAHGAESIRGPDAVVQAMRAALSLYRVAPRFDVVETIIADPWAFQRGIEHMTVTPLGGGEPVVRSQRALVILRRGEDGRWRYARGMTNGLPVPSAAPAP
jgi:uncharacterized protein (TIGR02246 family)